MGDGRKGYGDKPYVVTATVDNDKGSVKFNSASRESVLGYNTLPILVC